MRKLDLFKVPLPRRLEKRGQLLKQLLPAIKASGYDMFDITEWLFHRDYKIVDTIILHVARRGSRKLPHLIEELYREMEGVGPKTIQRYIEKLLKMGILQQSPTGVISLSPLGREIYSLL